MQQQRSGGGGGGGRVACGAILGLALDSERSGGGNMIFLMPFDCLLLLLNLSPRPSTQGQPHQPPRITSTTALRAKRARCTFANRRICLKP